MSVDIIAINSELFTPANAKISVLDRGFLFGDAIYEVTRSYGPILFQLEAHIARLFRSAEAIDLNLGKTAEQTLEELYRIHRAVGKSDRYIRWQVTRGEGPIGMAMDLAQKPNWVIYVKDIDVISDEIYKNGTSIVTSTRLRNSKQALDPNVKSGNYMNNVLAFKDASKAQVAEAVMIDSNGFCTEGTTSNIFRVKDGVLQTPPKKSDLLVGITRTLIFEIAEKNNIPIEEKLFTPTELEASDEAFLSGSVREITPISRINGKSIKIGPVVRQLRQLYAQVIKEYCDEAKHRHPWK